MKTTLYKTIASYPKGSEYDKQNIVTMLRKMIKIFKCKTLVELNHVVM